MFDLAGRRATAADPMTTLRDECAARTLEPSL
jgi:hypothetical protein